MECHLEKLLQIAHLVHATSDQTSVSLSEVLEVTEQTIRSNLACLRDCYSTPLEYSQKRGLYYMDLSYRFRTIFDN